MILQMFSIFDTKTGIFHVPFFVPHAAIAKRAVSDLVQDLSTSIGRHPADYSLYHLGEFDDATAALQSGPPNSLGSLIQFLPQHPALPLEGGK